MTISRMMIAPPNLQFFISDPGAADVPIQGEKIRIISSGEMISVPCRYWNEGDTELVVGDYGEVQENRSPVFDGSIPTPSRTIWFSDAELTELLLFPTPTKMTRLRIWTDGLELPERIVVGVG